MSCLLSCATLSIRCGAETYFPEWPSDNAGLLTPDPVGCTITVACSRATEDGADTLTVSSNAFSVSGGSIQLTLSLLRGRDVCLPISPFPGGERIDGTASIVRLGATILDVYRARRPTANQVDQISVSCGHGSHAYFP
jgi:hypothetical protein